jgi:hypothetical protein
MERRCTAAYCPKLPAPKPALCAKENPTAAETSEAWGDFINAVFAYDIGPGWQRLGEASQALRAPVEVPMQALLGPPAPKLAPPWVDLLIVDGGQVDLALHQVDGGQTDWVFDRWDGDAPAGELEQRLRAEPGKPGLTLRSDRQVLFRTVKDVMLTTKKAGFSDLNFVTLGGGTPSR